MAVKQITFDPSAGVPVASNLTIYGGADFKTTFNVVDTSKVSWTFTGYSGSAQMQKGAGVAATTVPAATFAVGFGTTTSDGDLVLSLGSTITRTLAQGRYLYNVLVSSGSTFYNIVDGNILVYTGIASAPS